MTRVATIAGGIFVVVVLLTGSAAGGVLVTDPNGMGGEWQDSQHYSGASIEADLDFCVYAPGQFNKTFEDPVPLVGDDNYVYAYQIVEVAIGNMGADKSFVRWLKVGLGADEDVDVIGYFDDGSDNLVSPSESKFAADLQSAIWNFNSPTVQVGEHSAILYFSSPFAPEWGSGTMSGWFGAGPHDVPSPTPEPGTLALMGIGLVAVLRARRKN